MGGATETELNEKNGQGLTMLYGQQRQQYQRVYTRRWKCFIRCIGYSEETEYIKDVLYAPFKQICENADVDAEEKLKLISLGKDGFGYNVLTDSVENLVDAGNY